MQAKPKCISVMKSNEPVDIRTALAHTLRNAPARLFLWALLTAFSIVAYSQTGNFTVRHYNTESGLPQNSVLSAVADRYGFLWLATENGLVRFDGQNFRVFNLANTPAIKYSDRIRYMAQDDKGRVYFNNALFHTYEITGQNTIRQAGTGDENIITVNKGLRSLDKIVQEIGSIKKPGPVADLRKQTWLRNRVYGLAGGGDYFLYDSIYYHGADGDSKVLAPSYGECGLYNDTIYHYSSYGAADAYYKSDKVDALRLTGDFLKDSLYGRQKPRPYCEVRNAMVIRAGNNYYRVYREGNVLRTVLLFRNLPVSGFQTLVYDQVNDQYIFCTLADGFFMVRQSAFVNITEQIRPFDEFVNAFGSQVLLPGDSIMVNKSILFDRSGMQQKIFKTYGSVAPSGEDGTYWNGFDFNVQKLDAGLRVLFELKNTEKAVELFAADPAGGGTWGASEYRLFKINEVAGKLEPISIPQIEKERIWYIHFQSAGKLWIGTGNGLYLLDVNTGEWIKMKNSDGMTVRNVLDDPANNIAWAGTYGAGPCYIRNNTIYPLPLDRQKSLLYSHYFVKDKSGYMWIPTNKGLYRAAEKDLLRFAGGDGDAPLYYQYFSTDDGIGTNEFNGGQSNPWVLRRDGILSMCSMKGLVWFTPEKIAAPTPDKQIFVDEIKVDGRDTSFAGTLRLPGMYNQLSIGISTPYFGNRENVYMEYRLDGSNDQWLPVPENNRIILSRLSYDDYKLKIRKRSGFGGSYDYAEFAFEVLPAWYETWWFRLLVLLIAGGLIFMGVRLRVRALVHRRKELEQQVESRTAELLQSNKMKESLISMVLHDLRSPIRFMNTVINYLAVNRAGMDEKDLSEGVEELQRSSASLNEFTDHFFTWISSQNEHFEIKKSIFPAGEIFSGIKDLYNDLFTKRRNTVVTEGEATVLITDKNVLRSIVRNLVDNANKNTAGGTITMSAFKSGDEVIIKIADTGTGMPPDLVRSLQKSLLQVNDSKHGFRMVKEMLGKISGTIDISSTVGKGTEITISLPLRGAGGQAL